MSTAHVGPVVILVNFLSLPLCVTASVLKAHAMVIPIADLTDVHVIKGGGYICFLRWLHVGGRGYTHSCIQNQIMADTHLHNNISSAAFADDLLYPTGNLKNLKIQALKLTLYSDWASLIVSGSKTKVTGKLNAHASKNNQGQNPEDTLIHELKDTILVQGPKTQFLPSSSPFLYLGVELTMDLCWKHQHRRMADNLKQKLEALKCSFVTLRQTLAIIRTAIIPSLAYAFPVTPCSPAELDKWDTLIGMIPKDSGDPH